VGGFIYLLTLFIFSRMAKPVDSWARAAVKMISFIALYLFSTFLIIPPLAKQWGRIPLSTGKDLYLQPATIWTRVLNRNYVNPELRDITLSAALHMREVYPGTRLNYLDANFPFLDNFPLFPHLSHNDGKKLDLSFCYDNAADHKPTNNVPSYMGYGICEEPGSDEVNTALVCKQQGRWMYSALRGITPQGNKKNFVFSNTRTRELVLFLAGQDRVGKIFIEPHLKKRMQIRSDNVVFHGCHAVRHDDHIHIQLR
jgi:hypothetical protein